MAFSQVAAAGSTSRRYVVVFAQRRERPRRRQGDPRRRRQDPEDQPRHRRRHGLVERLRASPAKADRQKALFGAAQDRVIGRAPGRRQQAQPGAPIESGATPTPAQLAHHDELPGAGRRRPPLRPAVGHADDPRDAGRAPTRASRATRRVRVGVLDTGIDAGHPDIAPNFDSAPEPELHRRRPARSTASRRRSRRVRARTRRTSTKDGHGTHVASTIGSAAQRHRHRRRCAQGRPREPPRRAGLGLLLPAAEPRRADVRRRSRHRRREHVVLHRSVALQLHGPTRPTRRPSSTSSGSSSGPRSGRSTTRVARGVTTIAAEGNGHTDLGQADVRRQLAGLPGRRERRIRPTRGSARSTTPCLSDAHRGRRPSSASRRWTSKPPGAQGLLLRLRPRAGRRRRAGRRHPLLPRHARRLAPDRERDPRRVPPPRGRHPRGPSAGRRLKPDHSIR